MTTKHFLSALFVILTTILKAQDFTINANMKTRSEFRHGQGKLFGQDEKIASFINQRVRLGAQFSKDWFTLYAAGQQIFTWGDAPQPQGELKNNHFGLFEGWAKFDLDEHWSIKLGRQVISYDDERILGALDWSQYGRFHDAGLLFFNKNNWNINIGLAYNQQGQPFHGNTYLISSGASYKTMQFIRLNKLWDKNSVSFLFMNNGFQNLDATNNPDGVSNMQTSGIYTKLPFSNFGLDGSFYYQSGKRNKIDISAYQFRLEASYQFSGVSTALGVEILSGKDYDDSSKKHKSFSPLFGTNHKFNGFMDLYYIGNLQGTTGLNDYYAKVNIPFGQKGSLLFMPHIFTSNAKRADNKNYLGTELDFVYTNKLHQDITLNVGYSHHFLSKALKNDAIHNTQNWGYIELYIKPTLFTTKK